MRLSEHCLSPNHRLPSGFWQAGGKTLIEAFTIAGLLQIVVLSGYNVMIVAEAVLKSLGFLPKRIALGGAVVAIVLFVCAAGAGSSAVRAGVMACIALYARATGKKYDALRGLFAAVVLMLLVNPYYLVYDPGFELSVVATLGLIFASAPIQLRLARIPNAFVRDLLATTLAAQLFVLPLLLYQTGNLSIVAIPANLLVMLAVPAAMLVSFVAAVVAFVIPFIAPIAGFPAYLLLAYIIGVANAAAHVPLAQIIIPAFPFVIVVLAYALVAYITYRLQTHRPRVVLPAGVTLET
jgi:competence protein ComEC